MNPVRILLGVLLATGVLTSASRASDTLIAGFNFGQFGGSGYPSTDGVEFTPAGSISAGFQGTSVPSDGDSGVFRANQGIAGAFDPGYATWYWDGSNGSASFENTQGVQVTVVEKGTNGVNNNTVLGGNLFAADTNGAGLSFSVNNLKWSIVANTTGYADTSANVNFGFAAYAPSGATIQWFFSGSDVPFASSTIAATTEYSVYEVDLPSAFYGQNASSIQGSITAGASVTFDNVQINGSLAVVNFIQHPVNATIRLGGAASFSIQVAGTGSLTYQWFNVAGNVALTNVAGSVEGAQSATLRLLSPQLALDGSKYYCVVNFNGATGASDQASLHIQEPASGTLVSESISINPGQDAVFEVNFRGNPPPSFQWTRDGVPLVDIPAKVSGATTYKLILSDLTESDSGSKLQVLLNNGVDGPFLSSEALLTVSTADQAPSIVPQVPATQTVTAGQSIVFKASVAGSPSPALQWQINGNALTDGPGVAGATTDKLELSPVLLEMGGEIRVIATNRVSTVGYSFQLIVQVPPSIDLALSDFGNKSVLVGGAASFKVISMGNPAPTVQWFKGDTVVNGAVSETLTISPVSASSAGNYYAVVTNAAGSSKSPIASLFAGTLPFGTSLVPSDQNAVSGTDLELRISSSGNPLPAIRWFKDGVLLEGANETVLGIGTVAASDAGNYVAELSNAFGVATVQVTTLKVLQSVSTSIPGKIQYIAPGSSISIGNPRTGGALKYRWFKNGVEVAGATTPSLVRDNVSATDSGAYTLKVYNSAGRLLSSQVVATLRVSVAGTYDTLLRDPVSNEPVGRLQLVVADAGAYTGTLIYEDAKTYAIKGVLAFPSAPYEGTATLIVSRTGGAPALRLALGLDARGLSLAVSLSAAAAPGLTLGQGVGSVRLAGTSQWAGRYSLALAPQAPLSTPRATATLTGSIGGNGVLALSGRLADGTAIKASVPASADASYAIFLLPYKSGGGYVAGELKLVKVGTAYRADLASSGVFFWVRPAVGAAAAIDVRLAPTLAPR